MANKILLIGLVIGLILTVAYAVNAQQETTCTVLRPDGTVFETFKTLLGSEGCQKWIGYCDSETCWAYANYVFHQEGLI